MISGSRKGNLFDMFTIMVVLAVAVIVVLLFVRIVNQLNTDIQADASIPSAGKDFIGTIQSQNGWTLDFIFLMLLIALPLVSAVLAFFNDIPPWLYLVTVGLWLLVIVISNVVGDAYLAVSGDENLSDAVSSLPMTDFIMSHFVLYAFFSLVVIAFGVYMKSQAFGGYY